MKKFIQISIMLAALFLIGYAIGGYLLKEKVTATIVKTERVSDTYLIFTNKGVYSDKDDWRFFKFNSSDMYNKFSQKIRKPVTFEVTGFRVPFLSWYQNIIWVE